MNKLKLRQLAAFLEVYHRRKISLAAERMHMTQSAVSITLQQLELAVGAQLFDRTTRTLLPTKAALDLLPVAERMVRDARAIERMFAKGAAPGARLTLVATPTLAQTALPALMASFSEAHAGVRIHLMDVPPKEFVSVIVGGEADLGVGSLGYVDEELQQYRLAADHLCLVTRADSRLARGRSISWRSLQDVPLVLLRPGYGIREAIDKAALAVGASLQVSHEVNLLSTALALAATGMTHTVAPARIAQMSQFPGLVMVKLRSPSVERDICAVLAKNRSAPPLALRFIQHCKESLSGTATRGEATVLIADQI
jgi:LysR family carnitine catabolism transcriptional activator